MTFEDLSPQARKTMRYRRTFQVRTGNLVTEIQQDLGNATHADATDAYEMNALNLGEHVVVNTRLPFPRICADQR